MDMSGFGNKRAFDDVEDIFKTSPTASQHIVWDRDSSDDEKDANVFRRRRQNQQDFMAGLKKRTRRRQQKENMPKDEISTPVTPVEVLEEGATSPILSRKRPVGFNSSGRIRCSERVSSGLEGGRPGLRPSGEPLKECHVAGANAGNRSLQTSSAKRPAAVVVPSPLDAGPPVSCGHDRSLLSDQAARPSPAAVWSTPTPEKEPPASPIITGRRTAGNNKRKLFEFLDSDETSDVEGEKVEEGGTKLLKIDPAAEVTVIPESPESPSTPASQRIETDDIFASPKAKNSVKKKLGSIFRYRSN